MKSKFLIFAVLVSASVSALAQPSTLSKEQQVQQVNKELLQSMARQNVTSFDRRVDDNAIFTVDVNPTNVITLTKASAREGLTLGKRFVYTIKNIRIIGVRVHGDNAVIVGRVWGIDNKAKQRRFAFTNVFIQRQGDWQFITGHYSN